MNRSWMGALGSWLMLACGPAEHSATSNMAGGGANAAGSSAAGSATGGTSAGGSAAGGSSGGTATGGGGAGGSGGVASGAPQGTVQFGRLLGRSGAVSGFEASARFFAKGATTETDCSSESFGDCRVSTCTSNPTGTPTPKPYAGTITLSDGKMINVTLMGTKGQDYTLPAGSSGSVSGGESITVTASGDDVPAFMATVAVPKVITITTPTVSAMGVATAPRTTDLVLTFNNRSADGETGTVLYVQSQSPLGSANLNCDLPTASGTATIPSAALQKLAAGTSLLLLTTRSKQVQAGDFAVTVIGYISAMNPDKTAAATIQLE